MPTLDELIKNTNKTAKEEIVSVGLPTFEYEKIPFTSPRMNYCTFGGIPIGKLVEFSGEEHGGKTTTALDIISNYQRMDDARKVLYVDAENTLDAEWAQKIGVDTDSMIILQPKYQSAEEILQFILDAIETDEVGLWVLDSIGVLASSQELDKKLDEKTYAGISSALTVFSRKAEMLMKRHRCTGIGINQLRDDLGAMWAGATKTPGGKAWKHNCAMRLQFSKGKYIDENGNELNQRAESPAGNYVIMSILKTKTCPPTRRTGFYTLNYDCGIDYFKDLVDIAIKYNLIIKGGAWYSMLDASTGEVIEKVQGIANVYKYLSAEEHEPLLESYENYIDEAIS